MSKKSTILCLVMVLLGSLAVAGNHSNSGINESKKIRKLAIKNNPKLRHMKERLEEIKEQLRNLQEDLWKKYYAKEGLEVPDDFNLEDFKKKMRKEGKSRKLAGIEWTYRTEVRDKLSEKKKELGFEEKRREFRKKLGEKIRQLRHQR